jgi:hypothetical protein
MHRYFAWLAFEQRDYRHTLALLAEAFGRAPGRAVADVRNWMLMAAACGGLLLPDRVQRQLLHLSTAIVRRR